jgi:hypothetical protein
VFAPYRKADKVPPFIPQTSFHALATAKFSQQRQSKEHDSKSQLAPQ